jgi:lysophospholipase L1-like esterase
MKKAPVNNQRITSVACFGDSITKGTVSYNWVRYLSKKLPRYQWDNYGRNGDLAFNALQRIEKVIRNNPDYVVIVLGTNDILQAMPEIEKHVRKMNLPQKPDIEWFQFNLEQIIGRFQEETKATIFIASLPVLGEGLNHRSNQMVREYNEIIRHLAKQYDLEYLPYNEALVEILEQEHSANPVLLQDSIEMIMKAPLRRFLLGQDWDTISSANGLRLTTDNIHLNTRSGMLLGDLILKRLELKQSGSQ